MSEDDDILITDRESDNRAYNAARAEWHSYRAAVTLESSARILHEKFAALYRARADTVHPRRSGLAEI